MNEHFVLRWFNKDDQKIGKHLLILMFENDGIRSDIMNELRTIVCSHYINPEITAKRLEALGAAKTAELLQEHLPTTKIARSGDLGEILAIEVAEQHLEYEVPVRRLQWKDGREMALRGDDITGLVYGVNNKLRLLKGESKSRAELSTTVLDEANDALAKNLGRPSRHTIMFIANRLRDKGEDVLAEDLEEALLQSFQNIRIEHMLFILSGNNPENLLTGHMKAHIKKKHRRYAVGVHIKDHRKFIESLFGGI